MVKYQFKILDKILSEELGIETLNIGFPFHKIHTVYKNKDIKQKQFKLNVSKYIIAKKKRFTENTIIDEEICKKAYKFSK